jgi:serine/threonine protein kinase
MPAPTTLEQFLALVRRSELVDPPRLNTFLERRAPGLPSEPKAVADLMLEDGILTRFQSGQLLQGRWHGFTLGKYRLLEELGSGGMAVVYLCEHLALGRRVAIKVLPPVLAQDPWFVERFYREAWAVAALDHPNIVRVHDIDRANGLHFLVMEYVDGSSLQEIVDGHGPLTVGRAALYVRQAALALQHIHEVGFVHRDIKPANLLLSRQGLVKILDMGLSVFFRENCEEAGTRPGSQKIVIGTDDYVAPEQIVDSDGVDIRADIYSLGATLYFLLTGTPPFANVAPGYQKLIRHLGRRPQPICDHRPEVPEELVQVIDRMMAKNPWERYQTPAAVAEVLSAWTPATVPPPPDEEMPCLSPAAQHCGSWAASLPAGLRSSPAETPSAVTRESPQPPVPAGPPSNGDRSQPKMGNSAAVAIRPEQSTWAAVNPASRPGRVETVLRFDIRSLRRRRAANDNAPAPSGHDCWPE